MQGGTDPLPWADLPAYRAEFRARNPLPGAAPAALADRAQWLLWRYEPGETPEKKPRKMPYYADGGRRWKEQGSERDRSHLVPFAAAVAAAGRGDFDGVGFAFLPGDGLLGIDLDGMIDAESGEVADRCLSIIQACDSYTEYSPSGTGVHILCAAPADGEVSTFKNNKVGIEVFTGRQYFTFTGRAWSGAPDEVREITQATLRRLYVTVKGKPAAAAPVAVPAAPPPSAVDIGGGRQRSRAETVALAEDALAFLSPDEYAEWIETGMALVELGAPGYMVWDAWSSRSPKYAGPDDTAKRWAGFKPTNISMGTVFARAEAAGWVSPWAKARARKPRAPKAERATAPPPAPRSPEPPPEPSPPARDDDAAHFDFAPAAPTAPAGVGQDAPGAPPDDGEPPDEWERDLLEKKGDISPCLANAELILSCMREWRGAIGYNEFAEKTEFRRPIPCERNGPDGGEWTDLLDITTAIWLQRKWGVEFSASTVAQAVEVLARKHRFHPVREALEALPPWDGVRRNAHWLSDFLGVEHTEYVGLVGQFFLRGMIKRVMEPGCKFDYCLVLEGEQGRGKSTAARILSWNWFADTDLDLSNKDSLMALPGHWVYEIAELGSLMKAEERKQKSFLSRQDDEYRPPYGKRIIKVPRQSVFIGTTNEEEYLKDATGARRFWPVMCAGDFNLDGLLAVRELLYAEALHDYRNGERCWPTHDEQRALFNPEQAKRGMPEPFEDYLYDWVNKQPGPFSMADVAAGPLNLTPDKLTPAVVTRIGITLRKLGCGRVEDRLAADPGRRRLYTPPSMNKGVSDIRASAVMARVPVPSGQEDRRAPF